MLPIVSVLLASVFIWFRSRLSVQMELIALRHQVAVYQQSIPRPKLRPTDRLLWAWLSHLWPRWQQALAFVQPRTIIAWQKKRFRDHWRRLSQSGKPGQPAIAQAVRELRHPLRFFIDSRGLAREEPVREAAGRIAGAGS